MRILFAVREILKRLHILLTSAHSPACLRSRNTETFIDLFSTRPTVAPSQCWAASMSRHLTDCCCPEYADCVFHLCQVTISTAFWKLGHKSMQPPRTLHCNGKCCVTELAGKFASHIFFGLFCLSRKMYDSRRGALNCELWNYPYKRWHCSLGLINSKVFYRSVMNRPHSLHLQTFFLRGQLNDVCSHCDVPLSIVWIPIDYHSYSTHSEV